MKNERPNVFLSGADATRDMAVRSTLLSGILCCNTTLEKAWNRVADGNSWWESDFWDIDWHILTLLPSTSYLNGVFLIISQLNKKEIQWTYGIFMHIHATFIGFWSFSTLSYISSHSLCRFNHFLKHCSDSVNALGFAAWIVVGAAMADGTILWNWIWLDIDISLRKPWISISTDILYLYIT